MTNPYTSPSTTAPALGRGRWGIVMLRLGYCLLGVFACSILFTVYLFIRYPLLEDPSAIDNKSWPIDILGKLALLKAVLAVGGGLLIGVGKVILKSNNSTK